jgi:cephalosporin hydroxylase
MTQAGNSSASKIAAMALPPNVEVTPTRGELREYWLARAAQHTQDSYAGVPLSKFPEDLRVYEHLLWESAANVVIELGAWCGASALWFRDRLRANASYGRIAEPLVISIDIEIAAARAHIDAVDPAHEGIVLLEGSVTDPALPERVAELVPAGARCLVVEDSAHVYETTYAALEGFHRFVGPGGFFVVEDGCVDVEELRLSPDWPRGVLPAVNDWLATPDGQAFTVRRELELYGLSCHPSGFLQRTPD